MKETPFVNETIRNTILRYNLFIMFRLSNFV